MVPMRVTGVLLAALLLVGCEAMTNAGERGDGADEGPATLGALQGRGARSLFEGREVAVQAVVTGNFVAGLDGFFMQDAAGADDGDPRTSDAVFVVWKRDRTPKVRRGDRLRVTGKVVELGDGAQSVTAIEASSVEVLGRGGVNVTRIETPPADVADWERLEGMWLRVNVPLTVTGNAGLARFGELEVAFGERLLQPTEVHPPGKLADALAADNARRRLILDDNRRGEYPERLWYLADGLSQDAPLRAGSVLADVEGVLHYHYGSWRLQLTREVGIANQAARPEPPPPPSGLRVASVNLENYFNGNGRGAGFPTPRGAASRKEFERQTQKVAGMLAALQADLIAAAEMENDGHDARSAEAALLTALNAAVEGGKGDYRGVTVAEGGSGDDQIRVALFYRASRLQPLGPSASLTEGPFVRGGSRPPLAQAFVPVDGDTAFVAVANHFKSKGSCAPPEQAVDPGDRDAGDLQVCWNASRVAAAQALHDWLQTDPTNSGSDRVILLGDFNSYAQEDPLRLLYQLGWRDAFEVAKSGPVYSYIHNGQIGRLDHALVSPALVTAVGAAHIWHINADEAVAFDYRVSQRQAAWFSTAPWRTSDHDPLLIGLDFSQP